MMNTQNPALYPPQQVYAYGSGMAQPPPSFMSPSNPNELPLTQFQHQLPTTQQQTEHLSHPGAQIPPHLYAQYQQQQQQQHQQQHFQHQQQHQQHHPQQHHQQPQPPQPGFSRPQSQGNGVAQAQRQSPSNAPKPNASHPGIAQASNAQVANTNATGQQPMMNVANTPSQTQTPTKVGTQMAQPSSSSPQSLSRDKARVTILLEINAHLLQEVVTLQAQGKAGPVQQSPTSPNSTAENFNSPVDPNRPGPTKEYAECMRRLQANLSYLASVADAKKRSDGKIPPFPAIITPPIHLTEVHDLYKKLSALFPEAVQSAANRGQSVAGAPQLQNQSSVNGHVPS